jgi:hypothetical protein
MKLSSICLHWLVVGDPEKMLKKTFLQQDEAFL